MPAESPLKRSGRRTPSFTRLRRTPKSLTEEPTLFEAAPGPGGFALQAAGRGLGALTRRPATPSATGYTDDTAGLAVVEEQTALSGPVRERAREIAERLCVPRPRVAGAARRGQGVLTSMAYRGGSDDIDLDAILEVLTERPVPEEEDIIVRDRIRATRSVVLAVDVSGSAKGQRLQNAAATIGALAGELARDRLAVLAFWSDAAVLLRFGAAVHPLELLDQLLRIPARGLTNLAFPLELAAELLADSPTRESRVVLLSDCVHNAGPDPRPLAARVPRLDVLLDTTGEQDVDLGREMAHTGRGTLNLVRDHRDIALALNTIFTNA